MVEELKNEIRYYSEIQNNHLLLQIVLSIVLICVVLAITSCLLARFKNRNSGLWFFFTLIPMNIFGPIVLAWLPDLCEKCGYPIKKGYRNCLRCEPELSRSSQKSYHCKACGEEYSDNLSICPKCGVPRS